MADDTTQRQQAAEALEAEAKAQLAQVAAKRAEFDFQQQREAAKQGQSPVDQLKALKDALPNPTPVAPGTSVTFSDKLILGTQFTYRALPTAVKELCKAITEAELHYEDAQKHECTLIYLDSALAAAVAEYHALLARAQATYIYYEGLATDGNAPENKAGEEGAEESPTGKPVRAGFLPLAPAAVVGGLEVVSSGLALAQNIVEVFKIRKTISSAETAVNEDLFHDLVRAELNTLRKSSDPSFGAEQLPSFDWTLKDPGAAPDRTNRILDLIGCLTEVAGDSHFKHNAGDAAALRADISALLKSLGELGTSGAARAEDLAARLKDTKYLLLYTRLLHASATIVASDQNFKIDTTIKAHPVLVMSYTVMTGQGVVVASGVCSHSASIPYKL